MSLDWFLGECHLRKNVITETSTLSQKHVNINVFYFSATKIEDINHCMKTIIKTDQIISFFMKRLMMPKATQQEVLETICSCLNPIPWNIIHFAESWCRNPAFIMILEKQIERCVILISICQLYKGPYISFVGG